MAARPHVTWRLLHSGLSTQSSHDTSSLLLQATRWMDGLTPAAKQKRVLAEVRDTGYRRWAGLL